MTTRNPTTRSLSQWMTALLFAVPLASTLPDTAHAALVTPPGDINGSGAADVSDVQCAILATLWTIGGKIGAAPACLNGKLLNCDLNCDLSCDVTDVQICILSVLKSPIDPKLDKDSNQLVDVCEAPDDHKDCTETGDCIVTAAPVSYLGESNGGGLRIRGLGVGFPTSGGSKNADVAIEPRKVGLTP